MIDALLERNCLPDGLVRFGIRRLLARRLREIAPASPEEGRRRLEAYIADLDRRPLAERTADANAQHYEVPTAFYQACLGPRLKYSSCLFPTGNETLAEAEEAMLGVYVERAGLADGQEILDLGCGWGSLTLYLAERFPSARITAVSNSRTQRSYIEAQCARRGWRNVQVLTRDINELDLPGGRFDRVVSVEMFEHLKNYRELLRRIAGWLRPEGRLFIHIFTHRDQPYHFVARDGTDWMARHFFSGGQMPSHGLLKAFADDLAVIAEWKVSGVHYQRTAEAWLRNMDAHRSELQALFRVTYGEEARKWWAYWRTFYLSCAELWGYRGGSEWLVSHYLLARPDGAPGRTCACT
ncbi:MAG TPA: cyclopropane-fatty-acyl-phospholipid synthase family protein [Opitutaceae bacterium]|nr:cyclopropane-fatty-acyl-phospholipid synthase family protein [Opitutaceae bacterium]